MSHSTTNRTIPPDRDAITRRLPWAHRTILALFEIDPQLASPRHRPRLRLLFASLLPDTPMEKSSEAISDLFQMHKRGFPIDAFTDWNHPRASETVARNKLKFLRGVFGHTLPTGADERDAIDHLLRILGFNITKPGHLGER